MSSLTELIDRAFEKNFAKTAIFYNQEAFSYQKIGEAVNRLAQGLVDKGIKPGNRVVILLPNFVFFPICYYAILKIGAIAVPLNFLYSGNELAGQIQLVAPDAIIIWDNLLNKIKESPAKSYTNLIILGDNRLPESCELRKLIAKSPPLSHFPDIKEDDTAVILFTGGTTGRPKAVELSHQALTSNCQAFRQAFMLNSTEIYLAILPFFLPITLTGTLNSALLSGATLVIHTGFEIQILADLIKQYEVTVLVGNSMLYQAFLDSSVTAEALHSLKYCINYGMTYQSDLHHSFEEKFGKILYESYGLTEATALVAINRTYSEHRKGSVGNPLEHVHVRIVNDQGETIGENEIGEIVVEGSNLMKGYPGLPEETARVLKDGWLFSGDIGKIDEFGDLFFLERKQNVILKSGFHVFSHEIENHILTHPKVQEVAVIGIQEANGEEVKAFIVPQENAALTTTEIMNHCQQQLENYKCPKYIQILKSLPKGPTGKVLKYRLKEN
ncbi:AMP-binding protein [candidate division KSB1 bacterium]|nr:AMP-binding protein [candidate division KSB1 bacterium]